MESQAFENLLKALPEEVKIVLVLFVCVVLFYPKLAAFFGHFSPQQRAIRRARQRREMEELGIAVETPAPPSGPPPAADRPASAAPASGLGARLARLRSQQLAWCFAGAFATNAIFTGLSQISAATHFSQATGSYAPYYLVAPQILFFGGIYALGISVLGVLFFGERRRWGSLLLGIGLTLALWMLQYGMQRLAYG